MDRWVIIQSPETIVTANGQRKEGTPVEFYATWGKRVVGSGGEQYRGDQLTHVRNETFVVRYFPGIGTDKILKDQESGTTYKIRNVYEIGIKNRFARHQYLAIECEMNDNDGTGGY